MGTLANRVVTGVIVATGAATAVGFWLSYAGLHDFAVHAGLRGPEAWAWPGSVDLFILAGEAGVTIAALRRQQDKAAWIYLAIGFAASVTANVLHVEPAALAWTRYAVAAVPPVTATLALAALLRQVYKLAARPEADAPHPLALSNWHAVPEGGREAAGKYAASLSRGQLPSLRQVQREMQGQPWAREVRSYLELLAAGNGQG